MLQPHEGSSETGLKRMRGGIYERLQPHEGSSETGDETDWDLVAGDASTPRGFV